MAITFLHVAAVREGDPCCSQLGQLKREFHELNCIAAYSMGLGPMARALAYEKEKSNPFLKNNKKGNKTAPCIILSISDQDFINFVVCENEGFCNFVDQTSSISSVLSKKNREMPTSFSGLGNLLPSRLFRQLEQEMETVIKVLQPGPLGIIEHKFSAEEIREADATVRRAVANWQRNANLEQKNPIFKDYIHK